MGIYRLLLNLGGQFSPYKIYSESVFKTQFHPERFVKGPSTVKKPDDSVWINKPDNPENQNVDALKSSLTKNILPHSY